MSPAAKTSPTARAAAPVLADLEISDLGIIDRVTLELEPGLNVLTGETGAGKTMVVSALQWLLGARADKDKVRTGAPAAVVQVRLAGLPTSAAEWADPDDEDLVVTREVAGRGDGGSGVGRSRARIAGRLAPVSSLADVLGPVVEIHSQHEAMRLADPREQRALLDRHGGEAVAKARDGYDRAYAAWRSASRALAEAEALARDGARESSRLRFEVGEIDAVDPQEGEEDALDVELARLEHGEALRVAATSALDAINDDGGARDTLGAAVAAIRGVVRHDETLTGALERLGSQLAEVQEVAIDLTGYLQDLDADPALLDRTFARRAAIGGLLRKYGATTAEVRAYAADARERLALIDGGEERIAQLREAEVAARAAVEAAGEVLRAAREAAGHALATTVDGHLADLAMPDARTQVVVAPAEPTAEGADRVEFLLAANRGQPPLPLAKAASGGERSRVALALRVALADADETPVMIFDEVDAGIGGETALAVGRKLATLASSRQVICVTHLAQLAAFADAHFVVEKTSAGQATTASVHRLADEARPEELARMLSGAGGSATARSHARELLASAGR